MRPSVCYVASYDPAYSRNTDTVRALDRAGARVEFVSIGTRSGSRQPRQQMPGLSISTLARLAARSLLPIDVALRMLRCRALVIGYFGQLDMLLLGPLAKCLGKPVIFNPLVTLTDTLVEDRKLLSEDGLLARLVARLDRRALSLADLVLVDTEENAEHVTMRFGIDRSRIIVFPVGVDERIFHPAHVPKPGDETGLDVLFYGKFIPLHGVETIVRAAAIVESRNPGVRFEMVGTGQRYRGGRQLAADLGTKSINWTDWLPYEALGERLREADVALGVFSGGSKAARVIPNKVHQALACGIPVVTRRSPAVERVLEHDVSAVLVPPDDPRALAGALLDLANNPEARQRLGARGRDAWLAYASDQSLSSVAGEALKRVGVA